MSLSRYQVTPWRSHQDLLSLRERLFHGKTSLPDPSTLRTLRIWKLRGNLPHAIESTWLLLSAKAFHANSSSSKSDLDFPIRATYTTALSRFVTGYADIGRHKAGPGQTMLEVARTVGLPIHFVELRHEATHGELPNLHRLVDLADEAIEWLRIMYWAKLGGSRLDLSSDSLSTKRKRDQFDDTGGLQSVTAKRSRMYDDDRARQAFRELAKARIREYRREAKPYVQRGEPCPIDIARPFALELASEASEIRKCDRELLRILTSPGFMVPSDADLTNISLRMQIAFNMFDAFLRVLWDEPGARYQKSFISIAVATYCRDEDEPTPAGLGMLEWMDRVLNDETWTEGPRKDRLVWHYCRKALIESSTSHRDPRLRRPVEAALKEMPAADAFFNRGEPIDQT